MSLQHSENKNVSEKTAIVSFRCRPEMKRALRVMAAQQGTSVENILDGLLAPQLGLPVASSESANKQADSSSKIRTA
jgi:hypothetical protein